MHRSLAFLILFPLCHFTYSQSLEQMLRQNDTSEDIYLPDLMEVIDSAMVHSPVIKIQNAVIEKNAVTLEMQRSRWLKSLSLVSGVYYGNANSLSVGNASNGSFDDQFRTTTDTRYNVGASLRLPLDELLTRPQQIKIQKITVSEEQLRRQQYMVELEKLITHLYNELKLSIRVMKIHSGVYQTAMLHLQMAEKHYYEGEIQVGELSTITRQSSQSVIDLEKSKRDVQNLLSDFKELVGLDIQSFKQNPQ